MVSAETKRIALELPWGIYQEVATAKKRQETSSIAEFVRQAVIEKVARVRWQHNLSDLRAEIREAGGLKLQGSKEQVIERLRETRRQVFAAEYAHLYG